MESWTGKWMWIELVAKGLNNKEIAQSLYLSEGTVRNYLSTILDKLSLRDRTQLAVFIIKIWMTDLYLSKAAKAGDIATVIQPDPNPETSVIIVNCLVPFVFTPF